MLLKANWEKLPTSSYKFTPPPPPGITDGWISVLTQRQGGLANGTMEELGHGKEHSGATSNSSTLLTSPTRHTLASLQLIGCRCFAPSQERAFNSQAEPVAQPRATDLYCGWLCDWGGGGEGKRWGAAS